MPEPALVRELFLHPLPSYLLGAAARLVGMTEDEVRGWMEAGELEGIGTRGRQEVIAWADLLTFALGFWEQEDVEAALGDELPAAIPELCRLTELYVRVPRMEVVALERVAAREGRSVDALLARELLD